MVQLTNRRHLFGVLAAGFVAVHAASAQDLKTVRVGIVPVIDYTPVVVAIEKGFFAEQGLRVVTQSSGGGAASVPGLLGGSFDIVQGNPVSTILALKEGVPLVIIASAQHMLDNPAPTQMVAKAGRTFATAAELEGKTIAVNTRNSVLWLYAAAWAEKRGADIKKVTFREVGFPQMEDALRQGNVDVAFMVQPFKSAAIADGTLAVVGDVFSEVQPGAEVGHFVTTQAYAGANPQVLDGFLKGLRRGVAWYNENRRTPEGLQAVSSLTKIPVPTLQKMDLPRLPTTVSVAQLVQTAELMKRHGMLDRVPDISAHVNKAAVID